MPGDLKIDIEEVKRVYYLIEEIHDFFHQPLNYSEVDEFANKNYQEIAEVYYKVVWNWLPKDLQSEIENQ